MEQEIAEGQCPDGIPGMLQGASSGHGAWSEDEASIAAMAAPGPGRIISIPAMSPD